MTKTKNSVILNAARTTGNYPPGAAAIDLHVVKIFPPGRRYLGGWMHHRPTALDEAIFESNYPPGTTIQELYNLHFSYVFDALKSGNYPVGTSVADLAGLKSPKCYRDDSNALGIAVQWFGHYPTGTTASELAKYPCTKRCVEYCYQRTALPRGRTFLHQAARVGRFPPGTVITDLLGPRDHHGNTPLHDLAAGFKLGSIEGATKAVLSSVANNAGETAWDVAWSEEMSDACFGFYDVVFNLESCTELFTRLDRRKKVHRRILELFRDYRRLTPEKKAQITKMFPRLLAEFL